MGQAPSIQMPLQQSIQNAQAQITTNPQPDTIPKVPENSGWGEETAKVAAVSGKLVLKSATKAGCKFGDNLMNGLCWSQCPPGSIDSGIMCNINGLFTGKQAYVPQKIVTTSNGCNPGDTLEAGLCRPKCDCPQPYVPRIVSNFENTCNYDNNFYYLLLLSIGLLIIYVNFYKFKN